MLISLLLFLQTDFPLTRLCSLVPTSLVLASLLAASHPSARMRDSWDSGRFWFNLASRNSVDVDQIYWQILHKEGLGEAMLVTATFAGKEEFLERKEVQFKAYLAEKQSDTRFDE